MPLSDIRVLPTDDILEHQENADCWCDPEVEAHGANLVIIHNSFDGRERGEHLEAALTLIADIAYDRDGYKSAEKLGQLIDEIYEYACNPAKAARIARGKRI